MEVIARVSFWVESIFIPTRGASGMYHGPQWPAGQHPTEMFFSVEHWDRSMDYSRRNNIIYIYLIYMYINIFIVCWMCIYIVHIWLRIKTVNLEIDRKCSRLAKLCWTQVHLLRDPFGATQNLLWRQGSCRSHHRIPYHDRLLLVCWRTCARLTGTSA